MNSRGTRKDRDKDCRNEQQEPIWWVLPDLHNYMLINILIRFQNLQHIIINNHNSWKMSEKTPEDLEFEAKLAKATYKTTYNGIGA